MDLSMPGERRVYRIGEAVFRVWVDHPEASADYFKDGGWVWTPIPSISIMEHPKAEELTGPQLVSYGD